MPNRGAPSTFVCLGAIAPATLRDVLGARTYATWATPYQLQDSIPSTVPHEILA